MARLGKKRHAGSVVAYYCACTECGCTCNCWCECNFPEELAGQNDIAGEAIFDNRYFDDYNIAHPSRYIEHISNPI